MRLLEIREPGDISKLGIEIEKNGNFQQSFEWGEFQKTVGRRIVRHAVLDEDGQTLLYLQAIIHKFAGKIYFFAPFGPIFASDLAMHDKMRAFNYLAVELKKSFPYAVFLRVETEEDLAGSESASLFASRFRKTADLSPHKTLILNLQKSEKDILSEMKPKTRYNIKVAEKEGVEVRILNKVPVAPGGSNPLSASSNRSGVRAFPKSYLDALLKFFAEPNGKLQAKCYAAYHENDLLAANIMLYFGEACIYLFGGSFDIKRNAMPSYALHWQAIADAKAENKKFYDFWGVETDENHPWHGFSKFKLGFGGEIKERPGTYDFVYAPAWYNAYAMLRKLNRLIRRSS